MESDLLLGELDPWTGQGPWHWSPDRLTALNPNRSRTSSIVICSRSKLKLIPGMGLKILRLIGFLAIRVRTVGNWPRHFDSSERKASDSTGNTP